MASPHDSGSLAASLEMIEQLQRALVGVLDIRGVFERVSEIAGKVLDHDAMGLPILTDDREHVIPMAIAGLPAGTLPDLQPVDPVMRWLMTEPWDWHILDDLQTQHESQDLSKRLIGGYEVYVRLGYRTLLRVPIRLDGQLVGLLGFFSKKVAAYSREDALVARRVADYVALAVSHQRLAEEKSRAATLELLDQSLASLIDTGALPDQVNRISAVTRSVLAHDALALPVLLPDRQHARRYASSGLDTNSVPDVIEISPGFLSDPSWEYDLIDDARARSEPQNKLAAKQGFRSVLRVPVRLESRFVGAVVFLSRTPSLYKQTDVHAARRVAARIALTLEREHGLEEGKRADEAAERAARLESRVRVLTEELDAQTGYHRVIGKSASWKQVLTQATQVAATETTVLLLGKSGTGKEVVGRFLHRASKRRDGPFVALNCAALPEHLLEAELFGYERGAFTGAMQSKPGQLEQAAGGTLFLDEVGEMSPAAQAKFLRVLQEREFQRLGGTRVLKTDARVVAATNRDLHKAMTQGTFREDLYYRLAVFAIRLPALRERRDDILTLSEAFLAEFGRTLGRPPSGISKDARARLLEYHWPGNVRELRNVLERASILCDGGLITSDLLAINAPATDPSLGEPVAGPVRIDQPPGADQLSSMERAMVERALHDARNNKSKAAKTLGLTRSQLYVRMRRYGLE